MAVHWYVNQRRLALYNGVRVRKRPDGAAFLLLPEVGEVRLEPGRTPRATAIAEPGGAVAAAILRSGGSWEVLIGRGQTASGAIDEVLGAVEQAFVDEVGIERARSISVSVFTQHPELADEQLARGTVRTMVIEGPGS